MTLADIIIVTILVVIVGSILYYKIKHRDKRSCSACAYKSVYVKKDK